MALDDFSATERTQIPEGLEETAGCLTSLKDEVTGMVWVQSVDIEEKEQVENFRRMTKREFDMYFNGESFQQGLVWNCYMLSALDSFCSIKSYEQLILDNTKIKVNSKWIYYAFSLPFGDPNAQVYDVQPDQLQPQIWRNWQKIQLIDTKLNWLSALMYALWKKMLWKNNFDFQRLSSWMPNSFLHHLLHWYHFYSDTRNSPLVPRKPLRDLIYYENKLKKVFENFDPNIHLLSLSVRQEKEYDKLKNSERHVIQALFSEWWLNTSSWWLHSISVRSVNRDSNGNIVSLSLSNPWDIQKSYDLQYPKCLELIVNHQFASPVQVHEIWAEDKFPQIPDEQSELKILDILLREINQYKLQMNMEWQEPIYITCNDQTFYDDLIEGVEKKFWHKIDAPYEPFVHPWDPEIFRKQIRKIISEIQEPCWNIDYALSMGSNKINFWQNPNFDWSPVSVFYTFLPNLAKYIYKVNSLYIIPGKWNKRNPFKLHHWSLLFDDRNVSQVYWSREIEEKIWSNVITLPVDWSEFGIKNGSKEQEKVIDFLNQLYISRLAER